MQRRDLILSGLAGLALPPAAAARAEQAPPAIPSTLGWLRLAARLRRLDEDGLNPADYAIPPDDRAASDPGGHAEALNRAATRALADLLHGRLRNPPNRPDILRNAEALPLGPWAAELATSPNPAEVLDRAALLHPEARPLKAALARARAVAAAGGFPTVSGGPADTIEPGAEDAVKIPALRARLAASDPAVRRTGDTTYDEDLVAAVKRFQAAEGLEADGRVGRLTLAALNRPAGVIVDQLRVALDMRRALAAPPQERRVEVNVPHQRLWVIEAGRTLLEMNVIVGKPARPTPMMRVRLTAVQFNPRWGVPMRNAREDLLPRFRRDPRAMMEKGFRVYAGVDGQLVEVNPTGINWAQVNPERFPYVIRQDAGEANALGRIKFIIPNADDIFMHDTPDRQLFSRPDRAFSSGCIRLEKPMELLELALTGMAGWDRAKVDRLLAEGGTSGTGFRHAMPVRLHYTTALVENGRVVLRPDLYGLDAAYARALDALTRVAAAGVR